jgi:hypothetical protein
VVSRFTSVWRKDTDGHWRVIADQGVDACDCAPLGRAASKEPAPLQNIAPTSQHLARRQIPPQ